MAFQISDNGVFTMFKGDTVEFEVKLNITDENGNSDGEYEMQEGDELIMTVRSRPSVEYPVKFSVTSKTKTITILPQHTAGMAVGKYSADIQLNSAGRIMTVFPLLDNLSDTKKSKAVSWDNFVLVGEVTV